MKVGYYEDDIEEFETQQDNVTEVAREYADKNHEICEDSDINFSIYVEDDLGILYEVKLVTEFNPVYFAESIKQLDNNSQENNK